MSAIAYLAYSQRGNRQETGGRYSYHEVWTVVGLSPGEDPLEAQNIPPLYYRVPHTVAGGATIWIVCYLLTGELDPNDESIARVTAEYQQDPLSRPIEISYFGSQKTLANWKQVAAKARFDGDPFTPTQWIVNTAGDFYNPPLTHDKALLRIEMTRRYANADIDPKRIVEKYLFHKNSGRFTLDYFDGNGDRIQAGSFAAGTAYMADFRAPEVIEPYYHKQATFVFMVDLDGWVKRVPNIGPRCRAGNSGDDRNKRIVPKDDNGVSFSGLTPLAADGTQLKPDKDGGLTVIENTFDVTDVADFNLLCLFDPDGHPL